MTGSVELTTTPSGQFGRPDDWVNATVPSPPMQIFAEPAPGFKSARRACRRDRSGARRARRSRPIMRSASASATIASTSLAARAETLGCSATLHRGAPVEFGTSRCPYIMSSSSAKRTAARSLRLFAIGVGASAKAVASGATAERTCLLRRGRRSSRAKACLRQLTGLGRRRRGDGARSSAAGAMAKRPGIGAPRQAAMWARNNRAAARRRARRGRRRVAD